MRFLPALVAVLALTACAPRPAAAPDSFHYVEGSLLPGRQPDGNSVLIGVPDGLVLVDTGRHAFHSDAVLAKAKTLGRPIVGIINTHWHLDHVSGNPRIKAAFPKARVWSTNAMERAFGDFLIDSGRRGRIALENGDLQGDLARDVAADVNTIDNPHWIRPDVVLKGPGQLTIGRGQLNVRIAANAATDADLWLWDPASRTVIVGDLVTLPAPFLDTACPEGWKKALAEIEATPFTTLIPGHGPKMDRAAFTLWRTAFERLLDCAAGETEATVCASAWTGGVRPLLPKSEDAITRSTQMSTYYVDMLRRNDGTSPNCGLNDPEA